MKHKRAFIREGDTLSPAGGEVKPTPQRFSFFHGDKLACYEGDPVYCYACQSWGVTKCVPPFLPRTDPSGRQANLDGDLCLCKCKTPPRLKALFDNVFMSFDETTIAAMAGAENWLEHVGYKQFLYDQHFQILNEDTGNPEINRKYRITYSKGIVEGVTDANGLTDIVKSDFQDTVKIELL